MLKLKTLLRRRGSRGIMSLRRNFDIADSNKNGKIDFEEFKDLLNTLRFDLKEKEKKALFDEFDTDGSQEIDYNEFVDAILGEVPLERLTRLKQVFFILDKNSSGSISQDELKDGFFYKRHPDVLHAKRTPEEVFSEFLDNIEYHFNLLGDGSNELNFEQFVDFYRNISFTYTSNVNFLDDLKAVWNLDA